MGDDLKFHYGMEGEKKSVLYIIIALVVIVLLGWWFFSGSAGEEVGTGQAVKSKPTEAVLAPALQLTPEEKRGDVSERKTQILARVRSGAPLTPEEKAEIGGLMLAKGKIYNFSEEERVDIFEALSK